MVSLRRTLSVDVLVAPRAQMPPDAAVAAAAGEKNQGKIVRRRTWIVLKRSSI